jgi:hypothetical protein
MATPFGCAGGCPRVPARSLALRVLKVGSTSSPRRSHPGSPRAAYGLRCSSEFEEEVSDGRHGARRRVLLRDRSRRDVTVPDAPGEGQRILSALKDSGVNLLAFLGFPLGGGQSQIDLVPEDPGSLREAAERAGVTLSEAKRALLIQGDDRVGAVADATAKLAEANINLTAAAATGAGSGATG